MGQGQVGWDMPRASKVFTRLLSGQLHGELTGDLWDCLCREVVRRWFPWWIGSGFHWLCVGVIVGWIPLVYQWSGQSLIHLARLSSTIQCNTIA